MCVFDWWFCQAECRLTEQADEGKDLSSHRELHYGEYWQCHLVRRKLAALLQWVLTIWWYLIWELYLDTQVRHLAVIVDANLSFQSHVVKTGFYHLRNVGTVRSFLSQGNAETNVHAFISSRFDYCHTLLTEIPTNIWIDCSCSRMQKF